MTHIILAFKTNAKGSKTVTIAQKREFRAVFWHSKKVAKCSVKNLMLLFCCNNSQLLKEELVCKRQTRFSVGKTSSALTVFSTTFNFTWFSIA